jgi:zinc/manganese transport system substrate-binding protein
MLLSSLLAGCKPDGDEGKSIIVTYSILGAIVKDMVDNQAEVTVLIPNGADVHEWEPSAHDIEKVNNADLIVRNGLGLEEGLESTLGKAEDRGVKIFTAADHIVVRHVGPGEGIPGNDPDQQIGAPDPHLWVDPVAMKSVVTALAIELKSSLGINASTKARSLESQIDALNTEIASLVNSVPDGNRKLVTGHESMGYFAERYGFKLVGAVIPNLSSQAEISAADMATLIDLVKQNQVKAILTEAGTSTNAVQQVAMATGARVAELSPVRLPADGSYFTFMRELTNDVVAALK